MSNNNIAMPLECVDEEGRLWRPYIVDFESPEGRFSVYLYAISFDHAHLQLEALQENGRIEGVLEGIV